ncbi:unnamed protein product [Effrenium voratum]|nr:unnamed protein product [Effrenium voratum]
MSFLRRLLPGALGTVLALLLLNRRFSDGERPPPAAGGCCAGIRCGGKPYRILVVHGQHKAYNLTAMYAPMLDTILQGLRSKEEQCSYRTVAVLPKHLSENGNYGVLEAGDVILHVGLEYEENFTRRCQEEFAPNVYCILFQTEHRSIQAPQGLCEVWEYTRANRPTAPVVRYVPPGFLPLEVAVAENDRQVQQAAASLAAFGGKGGLQWIFVGSMPRKRRSCWQHLRAMPELGHVQFRHVNGIFQAQKWKDLAWGQGRKLFLNMHKKCNASGSSPPLETNRVSTLLSFGGVVVSERVNSEDARMFEDVILVEENLFGSYSDWSPRLRELLEDPAKLAEFQVSAYKTFKRRFQPEKLLADAGLWAAATSLQLDLRRPQLAPPNQDAM